MYLTDFSRLKEPLRRTTIQRNRLPIDPLALLASQKAHHPGNVDGKPIPRQRRSMRRHLSTRYSVSNTPHTPRKSRATSNKLTACLSSAVYLSPLGM